jgi:hypothetical protein
VGVNPSIGVPGEEIDDHRKVELGLLKEDLRDVSGPDLVHCRNLLGSKRQRNLSGGVPWAVVQFFWSSARNPMRRRSFTPNRN